MRFLILAHSGDHAAVRVADALRGRHPPEEVRLISLEEIVLAPYWLHRLETGKTETALGLHDGTRIHSNDVGVVFNRLQYMCMPHFVGAPVADREYAVMEMFALVLSWLAATQPRVVGVPSPKGLGGPAHHTLAWFYLAAKAGLPTVPLRMTSSSRRYPAPGLISYFMDPLSGGVAAHPCPAANVPAWGMGAVNEGRRSLLVIGDEVCGDAPVDLKQPCIRLARLSGMQLLAIHFASSVEDHGGYVFTGVDPWPVITQEWAVHLVVKLLESIAVSLRAGGPNEAHSAVPSISAELCNRR
jgi:hypothetical protein